MKELLLEQLASVHNQTHWFVPLATALDSLSAREAAWKGANVDNSIAQIVAHLLFWNERYLHRLKGLDIPAMHGDNDSTFVVPEYMGWEELVERASAVLTELEQIFANAGEDRLQRPAHAATEANWYQTLANISTHNAYHIGQIVVIRRLQGAWNRENGVS